MIKRLDWDCTFFQIEIGEINFENKFHIANADKFDLLYVKSNNNFHIDIINFENKFEEEKIVYEKNLQFQNGESLNLQSINDINYNINDLYKLALESGKHSRFKLDSNFQNKKFEELYYLWIDNSVLKTIANDVLVYKLDEKIIGFVTYKIAAKIATIGLIAVDADFQGKGVGKSILMFLENQLLLNNIEKLRIPTQKSNIAACKFYENQHYKIQETVYIKHYWKK